MHATVLSPGDQGASSLKGGRLGSNREVTSRTVGSAALVRNQAASAVGRATTRSYCDKVGANSSGDSKILGNKLASTILLPGIIFAFSDNIVPASPEFSALNLIQDKL